MMILTYTFGQKHIDSAFENQLENKHTKILVSIFDKYTVLNNDIHIENIFTFNNGSHYNNDPTQDQFIFFCLFIRSLISKTIILENVKGEFESFRELLLV